MKNLAPEKKHRRRIIKKYCVVQILECYFLFRKKEDPTLLKTTTKDEEIKELKYKTDKQV